MNTVRYITRIALLAFAFALFGAAAYAQVNSDLTLVVTDNGSGRDTLRWGVNATATNGMDAGLGEEEQPPAPPDGVFDARWINANPSNAFGQGIKKNYRANNVNLRDTFKLKVAPGVGGYPMTIRWPSLTGYFGTASLRFVDGDGNTFNADMKTTTSFTFSNSSNSSTITITTFQPSAPSAGINASPSPLNFGIISIPTPGTKLDSVLISNTGATSITIDSVRSTDTHFVVQPAPTFPQTLAAGGSIYVRVRYTSSGAGSFTGTLRIYHNTAGSPLNVSLLAVSSSGEGVYFLRGSRSVFDDRAGFYNDYLGLKYSGATPVQGIQFKINIPNTVLKVKSVQLGPSITSPADWNFDYELVNASSGAEARVILYGRDTTVALPAGTYDSLFRVNYDVKDVKVCDGALGGDSLVEIMYLSNVQSVLATNLGETAGIGIDPNRDSTIYTVYNSSSRGDVNCDDRVDILDILETMDVVLGRKTFQPWQFNRADLAPWSPTWTPSGVQAFSDANNYGDHQLNVQDVVLMANAILNEQWPDGIQLFGTKGSDPSDVPMGSPAPGGLSIYDVKFLYTIARNGIDVHMNNVVPVKGIQMKLKAADAPADLDVKLNSAIGKDFTVQKKVVDGEVRLLIYSLSGASFDAGSADLLQMPYNVVNPNAIAVVEPITAGGTENQSLLVEYEVQNVAGVERPTASAFGLGSVPNPFSGHTSINFSLKNAMNVTLVVTDAAGRVITRIMDDIRVDAGEHNADFDATNLASGTYFATLTAGGVSVTQRMTVAH